MTKTLPTNHSDRMQRVRLSLDGLSVGDAFGELFFGYPQTVESVIMARELPRPPWHFTDDTIMSLSICEVLNKYGEIDCDDLAVRYAKRYALEPDRGYGGTAHDILGSIDAGTHWTVAASRAFSGMGSMGNGGAMSVAPLGAYFAEETKALIEAARKSAQVTHAHAEGQDGAIAIALAAAFAWNSRRNLDASTGTKLIEFVLEHTPEGETRHGIRKALGLERNLSVQTAASFLGNGSRVISQDTVPFALWCAARHLNNFTGAMWSTVSGLGDRDTNCAIVGGIVALSAGAESIPADWLQAREALKLEL